MHCDYLNITVPESDCFEVSTKLVELMASVGATAVTDELFKLVSGGTLKHAAKRNFHFYSASGDMLHVLRTCGLYDDFLSVFAEHPHRVTRIDVALDLEVPPQPLLDQMYADACNDSFRLTRKRLNHVKKIRSVNFEGVDTGTNYFGGRSAEVRARVYDKQHQLHESGYDCPHPQVRYELTATNKVGISLRDAHQPEPLFWHYMSGLLPPPANAPDWVPCYGSYELPKRDLLLPVELLKRKVECSLDVASLLKFAHDAGPYGMAVLKRELDARYAAIYDDKLGLAS